ncbi:MAG: lytic transglycosylase domain-containing protein [Pseudomonadota bacterium]|nr:lytic transglycosylase domain-containing protein [Pseudomonadota bacterium]
MVTRKPHHSSACRFFRGAMAELLTLLLPVLLLVSTEVWQLLDRHTPLTRVSGDASDVSYTTATTLPNLLSAHDRELYAAIFRAQKQGDWKVADAEIERLENRILLGHVLASRYLSHGYDSKASELADWLDRYGDHPEAADIYNLALAKDASLKIPAVQKQSVLGGLGDGDAASSDGAYAAAWHSGLAAWRSGKKAEAARIFSGLAKRDLSSPWLSAASAYWAYRSYNAIGNEKEAIHYLATAAQEPRSFYGILARKQMGERLDINAEPAALTETDMLEMIGNKPVRRAIALVEAGMNDLAEQELRALFPQSDNEEKLQLLALANALDLPSVQISMAKQLSSDDHPMDYALYPIPSWEPEGGFTIDPELIFALMRQESGFRASAVSPGGALGLMQLMPQTASLMQQGEPAQSVTEPVQNITLGQRYVRHLLGNNLVDGNLIYLLAAYNAGPARLQEWKQSLGAGNDPLLFIESIPFGQTRHYVMQVMTNYWIYSELCGHPSASVHALLNGHWPSYDGHVAMAENNRSGG